jgi:hypothetical protein
MSQGVLRLKDLKEFAALLFDRKDAVQKAAMVLKAVLDAQSPRLSDIAQAMPGKNPATNYKTLQRFLEIADLKEALLRLFIDGAPFVVVDPTEIPRPQAKRTSYVGKLKDGKTSGFQILLFAVPYRGRAIPFHFTVYSSSTITKDASSRNLEHVRAFAKILMLLGKTPLVLDREFSYESLLEDFEIEGVRFVIRLNISNQAIFRDEEGNRVDLVIHPGERVFLRQLYYKGNVRVNVAGKWKKGMKEPLWVITNMEPEEALEIYKKRMRIEESFKDLKSLLSLEKVMNKKQENLERVIALVLIAYAIGFMVGEAVRDEMYAKSRDGEKKPHSQRPRQPGKAESGSSIPGYLSYSSRKSD